MKKLTTLILLILIIGPLSNALAQDTWYNQKEVTVTWDAVNSTTDGTAIPSDEISYKLFVKDANVTNATKVEMGTTNNTQYTINFQSEGEWYIGVKTVRLDSNGTVLSDSVINWSSEPTGVNQTFAVRFYKSPAACTGLRIQ